MKPLYFSLGVLLLGVAVVDLLWTTLWVEGGAGPLTAGLMSWTWKPLRRIGEYKPRVRTLTGPIVLVLGLLLWIVLLWAGWMFVFASAENALKDTVASGPIDWVERFYFVGYSLFTMGNGDFVLQDGPWQIATALMTASGMLFVTLIITYVLSVLDAVTQKRTFARNVSGLGQNGEALVRHSWNGDDFNDVDLPLNSVTTQLNELTANHKAYPILHYFYTDNSEAAAVLSVTTLEEALLLWENGIPDEDGPSAPVVENLRSSIQGYLDTVGGTFVSRADEHPPPPDIAMLREAEIPTVSDEEFEAALDERTHRRTLHGLVKAEARQWPGTRDTR